MLLQLSEKWQKTSNGLKINSCITFRFWKLHKYTAISYCYKSSHHEFNTSCFYTPPFQSSNSRSTSSSSTEGTDQGTFQVVVHFSICALSEPGGSVESHCCEITACQSSPVTQEEIMSHWPSYLPTSNKVYGHSPLVNAWRSISKTLLSKTNYPVLITTI